MKQELPFAVVLLAIGSLLVLGNSWTNFWPSNRESATHANVAENGLIAEDFGTNEIPSAARSPQNQTSKNFVATQIQSQTIVPASYQTAINENQPPSVDPKPLKLPEIGQAKFTGVPSEFQFETEDTNATKLCLATSKRIKQSPPFGTTVRLEANLFKQTISASGQYYQMGQGSGKTRIELNSESGGKPFSVIKLCDGRFIYDLQSLGNSQELEFVDSSQVIEDSKTDQFRPADLMSHGGIDGLLKQVATSFRLGGTTQSPDGSITTRGVWRPERLKQIVSASDVAGAASLENIPPQLPHSVSVTLTPMSNESNSNPDYFPTRVTFFRFQNTENGLQPVMHLDIQFGQPKSLPSLNDDYFVVDSRNLESVDRTQDYVARLNSIENTIRTAAESTTTSVER